MTNSNVQAASEICTANRIVLACHINPDGDTLGSILALGHACRTLGKDVTLLSSDGVPDIYRWMPGTENIQTGTDRRDFQLAIVCDSGAINRIGEQVLSAVSSAPKMINIDHHLPDGPFGDIRVVDITASSTAELVWELIKELELQSGKQLANRNIADCLLTGIITDTGSFRYLNVTPKTFRIAADLQELGALPSPIFELVFENRSYASQKLLGRALDSLQITACGRIAWGHVTASDFEEFDADDVETEGIVNHLRAVNTALIGILFREVPGRKVRISLRAREGADVNSIAHVFGGGGHKLASGCALEPPLAEVERLVVAEAIRQLDF